MPQSPTANELAEQDLCARVLADDGMNPLRGFEDPTPIPGWVAAVENALNEPRVR